MTVRMWPHKRLIRCVTGEALQWNLSACLRPISFLWPDWVSLLATSIFVYVCVCFSMVFISKATHFFSCWYFKKIRRIWHWLDAMLYRSTEGPIVVVFQNRCCEAACGRSFPSLICQEINRRWEGFAVSAWVDWIDLLSSRDTSDNTGREDEKESKREREKKREKDDGALYTGGKGSSISIITALHSIILTHRHFPCFSQDSHLFVCLFVWMHTCLFGFDLEVVTVAVQLCHTVRWLLLHSLKRDWK